MTHFLHASVECLFSRMAEGRMAEIVGERRSLRQLGCQAALEQRLLDQKVLGDRPGYLRNFYAVSQSRTIKIRLPDSKNLGFPLESAKSSAMQNTVPIPFGGMAMIFGRSRILLVSPLQQKIVHIS